MSCFESPACFVSFDATRPQRQDRLEALSYVFLLRSLRSFADTYIRGHSRDSRLKIRGSYE